MIKDILREPSLCSSPTLKYTLDYIEADETLKDFNWYPYDFYVINWHPHTLAINRKTLDRLHGKKIAIVVEVSEKEYIPFTPDWFDAYAIIDPTKERKGKFFPIPRPIRTFEPKPLLDESKFTLGSFGLFSSAYRSEKRFEQLVQKANNSGRECIVRINLPVATYTYTPITAIVNYGKELERLANSNVEVIITHDYMEINDLLNWLSEHDLNCFPYYRERPGLSAVTDQAIAVGRGIMTTECNTFRHLHKYISFYPKQSYLELAKSTLPGVKQMQLDWSPENFRAKFDVMLQEIGVI
jgi:glycosyltransferase involved in cell wall biosynthesis